MIQQIKILRSIKFNRKIIWFSTWRLIESKKLSNLIMKNLKDFMMINIKSVKDVKDVKDVKNLIKDLKNLIMINIKDIKC